MGTDFLNNSVMSGLGIDGIRPVSRDVWDAGPVSSFVEKADRQISPANDKPGGDGVTSTVSVLHGQSEPHPTLIVRRLLSISKLTKALVGLKLGTLGIHIGQDEALIALDGRDFITTTTLAERIGVRPSTVTKMLDRMLLQGLVQRSADPADARRVLVRATAAGIEMRTRVLAAWHQIGLDLVKTMDFEKIESMTDDLGRTEDILASRLSRLR